MNAISIRLDSKTERVVNELARRKGQTRSDVIREAIALLAQQRPERDAARPFDALAPWIGCVRGGPTGLSARTGEGFRRVLGERRAPRG
jgi:hypothetical protein